MGWVMPGFKKFSISRTFVGPFIAKKFKFDTGVNGGKRAIIPFYSFERIMPMDIIPSLLLRSLAILDTDEANVQLALNGDRTTLYILNNDIFRMSINDSQMPVFPFISAPLDNNGRRHYLYGLSVNPKNGEIYVADAIDYSQSGVCYRYSSDGELIDKFRVGINPNQFVFK